MTPDEQPDAWMEQARLNQLNADYWRKRAKRAERFYPVAWWWRLRRAIRDNITARVDAR